MHSVDQTETVGTCLDLDENVFAGWVISMRRDPSAIDEQAVVACRNEVETERKFGRRPAGNWGK